MRPKYRSFQALLLAVISLQIYFAQQREGAPSFLPTGLMMGDVQENRLALGQRMPLTEISTYELELISGVSDTLANNILNSRHAILKSAERSIIFERAKALELAHGVGPKTAIKLEKYLSFE